ncbi:MAG: hypothetical protein LBM65_01035 [Oscillospiraceae bacterium]|jgi:hypothetical protein|nr:hypothetical protein [Oscillospiraceae bacterium]
MKNITKIEKCKTSEITEETMDKINKFTRRPFKKEEVYIFSVVLCDNDIDRDFERFTVEALFEMEKLFVGTTGIMDHNPKAENQTARLFECAVEAVEGQVTSTGDQYFRLVGKAYFPLSSKTESLVLSLDSGIKKEVSVGCSVAEITCSVCGKQAGVSGCNHKKGETYGGKLCFYELKTPTDAYEWSFVAVPSQKRAGVIKFFNPNGTDAAKQEDKEEKTMESILKTIQKGDGVTLTKAEAAQLFEYITELQTAAQDGKAYKANLQKSVAQLFGVVNPEISKTTAESLINKMSVAQLCEFETVYKAKSTELLPCQRQLDDDTDAEETIAKTQTSQFTI